MANPDLDSTILKLEGISLAPTDQDVIERGAIPSLQGLLTSVLASSTATPWLCDFCVFRYSRPFLFVRMVS